MIHITNTYDEYLPIVLTLYYYPNENLFVDQWGKPVYDIFDMLTPNDLRLFRYDPGEYFMFQHRQNLQMAVEIIEILDCPTKGSKGDFYETRHGGSNYRGCVGRNCEFLHYEEDARKEICAICRGGD